MRPPRLQRAVDRRRADFGVLRKLFADADLHTRQPALGPALSLAPNY